MNLNTDEMVTVAEVFQQAYQDCLSSVVGERRELTLRFVAEVILKHKPYMLVNPEGFVAAQDLVFGRDENRDFILSLSYMFFARLGQDDDFVKGLAGNLARGAAQAGPSELNAIPETIKGRLGEPKVVAELLEANYWLMILLMLQLFITVLLTEQKQAK